MSGDIPSGATYDFASDYKYSLAYLEEGQKNKLIIKGMPTNASITAVEVVGCCNQRTGKATVHAFMGETEFASLKYSGTRVEHGNRSRSDRDYDVYGNDRRNGILYW